ncbi:MULTISPECIES: helix-turn-helix transcriptional regulator [Photobacterium]|uniref:XRE family transcriptional regulator n=2 Tax=Photobacterium TaxID=657 RepID=A0A2T3LAM9_9GAMM|nr:XRE family transcriptional regulator [Photobacterium indicum]
MTTSNHIEGTNMQRFITDRKALAQRIRVARECRELTQVRMAKYLGLARQTYLDIETGKTEPKAGTLLAIAQILKTDYRFLLTGEKYNGGIPLTVDDVNQYFARNCGDIHLQVTLN